MARAARARGERTFLAVCIHHGETPHRASAATCVACSTERDAARIKHRQSDSAVRDAYNASMRIWRQQHMTSPENREKARAYFRNLHRSDEQRRGKTREATAARDWRIATKGFMPSWYGVEREALQRRYGALREGFEIDHGIPKFATDAEGNHIASGLHCMANVAEMPKSVNSQKRCQFAPETNRLQRPANRSPGGAFDPTPTEHERALIALAEDHGTPAAVSLEALRHSLDAKAREYEQHTAALIARITTA